MYDRERIMVSKTTPNAAYNSSGHKCALCDRFSGITFLFRFGHARLLPTPLSRLAYITQLSGDIKTLFPAALTD